MTAPSGLLVVDKPRGLTSHDVVATIRRRLRKVRVGHAGTLDPAATGVLIVLVGRTTKLAEVLMDEAKEYEATILLGRETDTADATGRVVREHGGRFPDPPAVERALERFRGEIEQVPPMVSALKVGGKRLYALARAGESVPRAPRRVHVDALEARRYEPPRLWLRVVCGRGTYLRAIASDLGAALGVGGMLEDLRRTAVGPFRIEAAIPVGELRAALADGSWRERLVSPAAALAHLPGVVVAPDHVARLLHGQATAMSEVLAFPERVEAGAALRVLDPEGRLLATARALVSSDAAPPALPDAIPFRIERVLLDPHEA